MSKKVLIIEGDYNDGDYVTNETRVGEKELKVLMPIFNKMKKDRKNKPRHYTSDWTEKFPSLTEEELEIVREYKPSHENGIHTITSIRLLEVISDKNLI